MICIRTAQIGVSRERDGRHWLIGVGLFFLLDFSLIREPGHSSPLPPGAASVQATAFGTDGKVDFGLTVELSCLTRAWRRPPSLIFTL